MKTTHFGSSDATRTAPLQLHLLWSLSLIPSSASCTAFAVFWCWSGAKHCSLSLHVSYWFSWSPIWSARREQVGIPFC